MSYGIKSYNPDNRNLILTITHAVPGREGTRIEIDARLHLCPTAVEPEQRVSVLSLNLWELHGADIPAATGELARVLERVAAGLREGPDATMALFGGKR